MSVMERVVYVMEGVVCVTAPYIYTFVAIITATLPFFV